MLGFEALPLGSCNVANRGIVLDSVIIGMAEDTNIIAANNIRPIALVADSKL